MNLGNDDANTTARTGLSNPFSTLIPSEPFEKWSGASYRHLRRRADSPSGGTSMLSTPFRAGTRFGLLLSACRDRSEFRVVYTLHPHGIDAFEMLRRLLNIRAVTCVLISRMSA